MQPTEQADQIFIFVIDETYGGDEENYENDSEQYRRNLEAEFGTTFVEVNIGPGFDIPAFVTELAATSVPLWTVVVGTFFLGKPISDNLTAWANLGSKIKGYFTKPIVLGRHGASILAVEAVFEEIGGMPKMIRLLSYRAAHISDVDDLVKLKRSNEIEENPPTINLGVICHVFEMEADGQLYRVSVDGKTTEVRKL